MAKTHQPAYETPILSVLYRLSGCLSIGVGIALFIGSLFFREEVSAPAGIASLAIGILFSLVSFGLAQVISHIARTAYHTEHIATLLADNMGAITRGRGPAIRVASPDMQRLTSLSSSATAACPSCMAELDVRTLRKGTNRCPSCRVEFVAE